LVTPFFIILRAFTFITLCDADNVLFHPVIKDIQYKEHGFYY